MQNAENKCMLFPVRPVNDYLNIFFFILNQKLLNKKFHKEIRALFNIKLMTNFTLVLQTIGFLIVKLYFIIL